MYFAKYFEGGDALLHCSKCIVKLHNVSIIYLCFNGLTSAVGAHHRCEFFISDIMFAVGVYS